MYVCAYTCVLCLMVLGSRRQFCVKPRSTQESFRTSSGERSQWRSSMDFVTTSRSGPTASSPKRESTSVIFMKTVQTGVGQCSVSHVQFNT